ncbi:hypothetical protein GH714_006894 [Hevea brasiliensis]|uniref:DUF4283 domain-containing protein n=1 Tax=Hevea brasiliensis TaxID=3981 RepID=A0A6A6L2Y5_HEVBR|nr:hypothetical protein GH714_006894 [Hevea brasiliensis]
MAFLSISRCLIIFKWIGSLCGEFILADGESLSLSKLDFARILILTDSPTLVSRTVVVNSNYMRFQINAVEEYCHDFSPSPIFKRKSHSPDISSETNSKDNNDNNDGASKDDLLGGDKQNSGDDNLNGKENDTSYYNSDGINCLKNEPGNGDGSYGGSGDKQSSNSGDNLACNVDDMVIPSSINEDPMTCVLADGSDPNILLCMLKTLSPLFDDEESVILNLIVLGSIIRSLGVEFERFAWEKGRKEKIACQSKEEWLPGL